jgi:hypothetical protein
MKKLLLIAGACISAPLLFGAAIIGYQDYQTRGTPGSNPASGFMRIWADTGSSTFKCLTSGGSACYFTSATSGTISSVATTSPITGGTITTTGTIACATCVTSAASLTSSAFMMGAGSQGSQTVSAATATAALNAFTSSLQGVAPSSGGGTANFLRADGTWAAPGGTAGITSLTGDATASGPGAAATTVAKVNGISYSATAAAHSVEVVTTANTTATAKVLPDCTDTTGNHLNFTQSTDAFSCGTSMPANSTLTIASGTSALGTSAISSGACATVVTTSATGTLSTDAIIFTPNASIKALTGYTPATTGGLTIAAYPTADNINLDVCNWSTGSITPSALTVNWRVVR